MNTASTRIWAKAILVASLSLIASVLLILGAQVYIEKTRIARATDPQRIFGISTYTAYLTIDSYDPEARTLTAYVYSIATNQNLPFLLSLDANFYMERQDATLTNGVYTGVKPKVPASPQELKRGMRALAAIRGTRDGSIAIQYLLIGDPFPRP